MLNTAEKGGRDALEPANKAVLQQRPASLMAALGEIHRQMPVFNSTFKYFASFSNSNANNGGEQTHGGSGWRPAGLGEPAFTDNSSGT